MGSMGILTLPEDSRTQFVGVLSLSTRLHRGSLRHLWNPAPGVAGKVGFRV